MQSPRELVEMMSGGHLATAEPSGSEVAVSSYGTCHLGHRQSQPAGIET